MSDRALRKTIWSNGRRGQPDWMRVLVDEKADRVEVKYKNAHGQSKKKVFFPDNKPSRRGAIAWAEAFRDERARLGTPVDTTHLELWRAYTSSPAWANLRETSKPSYTDRWKKWMNFRGADVRVDDTTLHHVDQYTMLATEQTMAINQVRQVLNLARVVYNWGQSRKLVRDNVFVGWRWKTPKDAVIHEPAEYSAEEYQQLLKQLSPQDGTRWRPWVALMIAGHHGGRANAVLNLKWPPPIADGEIAWPKGFQKNGKELVQPLTWDLIAALETARYWREALGYEGQWLLFAGGGNKKLGAAVTMRQHRRRRHEGTKVMTPVRKERTADQDTPYTYGALWVAIRKAEDRAEITHRDYRAFHGTRKMSAGNVYDATGDAALALAWIGDDIRQAPAYLKNRDERMDRAAAAAGTMNGKVTR